jgi:hypothetical protein
MNLPTERRLPAVWEAVIPDILRQDYQEIYLEIWRDILLHQYRAITEESFQGVETARIRWNSLYILKLWIWRVTFVKLL